jgi:6-phosphogluconolactonase
MAFEVEEHAGATLGRALAGRVAADLSAALADGRRAGLALPGDPDLAPFLSELGQAALDWERVRVTLTDELWVPLSDARSRQGTLSRTLFRGAAAGAEFVPLYGGGEPADALLAIATALAQVVLPLEVAVMRTGADMRLAGLVPGALGLEAALAPGAGPVAALRAPAEECRRVSLAPEAMLAARRRYLVVLGPAEAAALERAAETPDPMRAPVRALLDAPEGLTVMRGG